MIIIGDARMAMRCFVEVDLLSVYVRNAMSAKGIDIPQSIPTIGHPLKFLMDVALASLPEPINEPAKAVVSYI